MIIQAFEATLKKWDEQKEKSTAPSTPTALADEAPFNRQVFSLRLIRHLLEVYEPGVYGNQQVGFLVPFSDFVVCLVIQVDVCSLC